MKTMKRMLTIALSMVTMTSALPVSTIANAKTGDVKGVEDLYAKALQQSLFFYECQQAGELPEWNRVSWRADAITDDAVQGGWFDAGDHVKFNLPMAYTASVLAWGMYEYPDGLEAVGEMQNYVNNLTYALDYFVDCDLGDVVIYQCGLGQEDHSWWGPAELYKYGLADQGKSESRSDKYLKSRDCSAVYGDMAAALAAGYCALDGRIDETTRQSYLEHAINIFEMGDADRSDDAYNDSDASGFYRSSHFYDELFYAANWLYIATKDKKYLDLAESYKPNLGTELGTNEMKYSWCQCWDDVLQGGKLLMAINTGDATWKAEVRKHLDYWVNSNDKLDGGLCYVGTWGCLRYACGIGFITAVATDRLFKDDANYNTYHDLYKTQIDFCLGDNPTSFCYVTGLTENSPHNVHHRTAHGSWKNELKVPESNRHTLYGALAGGPTSEGAYEDNRGNYINNEVATDYNAAFTALLCKMIDEYGGETDPSFPEIETPEDEIYVETMLKGSDASGVSLSFKITNHTAWPARVVDNLSYRYYMDLSEIKKNGLDPLSVEMRVDRDQAAMYSGNGYKAAEVSKIQHYDGDIYYVEVTYPDGRVVLPISEGQQQCELLLALVYPNYGSGWDASNDYSNKDLLKLGDKESVVSPYITVYENGKLIYGIEPDGTTPEVEPVVTTKKEGTTTTTKTTTTTVATEPVETALFYGDVNCDGKVDTADLIVYNKSIRDEITLSPQGVRNADVDGDGETTATDVGKILKYLAGIIPYTELGA